MNAMEKALDDFRRAVALDPDENGMHARYRSARRVAAKSRSAMFGKIFSSDKAIYDGIDESEDAHVLTKRKCNAEDEVARVLRDESLKSKLRDGLWRRQRGVSE